MQAALCQDQGAAVNERPRLREDLLHVLRGGLMGIADSIPGVSGGTVALIVGIYRRLVTAISHVDGRLWPMLRRGEWGKVARHLDLRFLFALGIGIGVGLVGSLVLIHTLLEHFGEQVRAVFFGLVLASSVLVIRMVHRWGIDTLGLFVGGAVFAYWLAGLIAGTSPDGAWYLFLCGLVAICAMILPGISGSFILLLLGKYTYMSGLIKEAVKGNVTAESALHIAVFAAGCVVGLLGFTKLLRWLLDRHYSHTMACMCGIMLGALRQLWPFQQTLMVQGHEISQNTWPQTLSQGLIALLLINVAAAFVFGVDYITKTRKKGEALEHATFE